MKSTRLNLTVLVLLATVVLGAGCGGSDNGGGDGGDQAAADARLNEQAGEKTKQAADKVVQATPDKNLKGHPKSYKTVCARAGDPEAVGDIPPNTIKCHVEAFYDPYRGKPGGYIWSEDWLVPIQNGKLGTPVISGDYRIRNFLREDDKRNCTGRHRPSECLPQSVGGQLPG
jgi:hypothetical protein